MSQYTSQQLATRWKFIAAGLVVTLAGGALLWIGVLRSPGRGAESVGRESSAKAQTLPDPATSDTMMALSPNVIGHLADLVVAGTGSRGDDTLRAAVADTLLTWSDGSVDDWLSYLSAYGIDAPEIALRDPGTLRLMWTESREFFAGARFDVDRARVVREFVDPAAEGDEGWNVTEEPVPYVHRARRDSARAFLGNVRERDRRTVRIVIPGEFVATSPLWTGDVYAAEFRLEFTYNPGTGLWVLTEYGMTGPHDDKGYPGMPSLPM